MNHTLKYRPDIDGLRALAVVPVVLFHLDVALFSGGFVGVDVFFVISGFLITSIVYRDVQAGQFRYADFYERRVRRLFPALAAMLAMCSIAAWFMLMPLDYKDFVDSVLAALIFLANIQFWKETDYFDDPVETIPLLHTWSLAVEEQYYILFPPLLIFLVRFVPRHVNLILLGLGLLSLWASEATLKTRPESSFYLVHLRAWELLAGSLLATGLVPSFKRRAIAEAAAAIGIAGIVVSVLWLDKNHSFPGINALPAVLGTALVIHAGRSSVTMVGRFLSLRPLVLVGLLSYSLYLWHWPIFVFVRYYLIEPFTPGQQLVLFLVSIGVAWLSWRFVERPFRSPGRLAPSRQFLFRSAALFSLVLILVSLPGLITRGGAFRLTDPVGAVAGVSDETIPFRRPCFGLDPLQVRNEREVCTLGVEGEPQFILWGDSHALSLAQGVHLAASELGLSGRFFARSVCPPALRTREFRASEVSCKEFNESVAQFIERTPTLERAILVGVWSHYVDPEQIQDDLGFKVGLRRTLNLLEDQGIGVTIVAQVPIASLDVPSALARSLQFNRSVELGPTTRQHQSQVQLFSEYLAELRSEFQIRVVDPAEVLCNGERCHVQLSGRPLYRDTDHLSAWGSERLARLMSRALGNEREN